MGNQLLFKNEQHWKLMLPSILDYSITEQNEMVSQGNVISIWADVHVDDWYQKPQNKCLNVSQLQEKNTFLLQN